MLRDIFYLPAPLEKMSLPNFLMGFESRKYYGILQDRSAKIRLNQCLLKQTKDEQ